MALESKVKFSKARGAVGYFFPVVFQQKLEVFESSPVGHTFAAGGCVSQVHCKLASCSSFLPTIGKKVSPTVSPSQDAYFTANSKEQGFFYACYISNGSQTFLHFFVFRGC